MIKNIIALIFSISTFIILHYFIYFENTNTEIPLLKVYPDMSLDFPEIKLIDEIRPTYFTPFSKFQYIYEDKDGNQIIEETIWLFNWKMKAIQWKDIISKNFEKSWYLFLKWFAVNEHPSVLFFIIQYLLIIIFLVNIWKLKRELN